MKMRQELEKEQRCILKRMLPCSTLFTLFFLSAPLAAFASYSPQNSESMAVVLRATDIQSAEDSVSRKESDTIEENEKTEKSINLDDEKITHEKTEEKNHINYPDEDVKKSLPQVSSQTQHIGTTENPTIEGGLISAPEWVGRLARGAVDVEGISEYDMDNGMVANTAESNAYYNQQFILMILNRLYGLSQNLKRYDVIPHGLYAVLSRVRLARDNHMEKIGAKCAQIWAYWTAPPKSRVEGGRHYGNT